MSPASTFSFRRPSTFAFFFFFFSVHSLARFSGVVQYSYDASPDLQAAWAPLNIYGTAQLLACTLLSLSEKIKVWKDITDLVPIIFFYFLLLSEKKLKG